MSIWSCGRSWGPSGLDSCESKSSRSTTLLLRRDSLFSAVWNEDKRLEYYSYSVKNMLLVEYLLYEHNWIQVFSCWLFFIQINSSLPNDLLGENYNKTKTTSFSSKRIFHYHVNYIWDSLHWLTYKNFIVYVGIQKTSREKISIISC